MSVIFFKSFHFLAKLDLIGLNARFLRQQFYFKTFLARTAFPWNYKVFEIGETSWPGSSLVRKISTGSKLDSCDIVLEFSLWGKNLTEGELHPCANAQETNYPLCMKIFQR